MRTDIWDQLVFADKNKIAEDLAHRITWDSGSLLDLVNLRISAKTDGKHDWQGITDGKLMRGKQEKWNYILARTFMRPRDVIAFLNYALDRALARNGDANTLVSDDIFTARAAYSTYLKNELDEEILPHWPQWEEPMRACSAIATLTIGKDKLDKEYSGRRSARNKVDLDEALETLFGYSVIGYRRGRAQGGSEWVFQYANENAKWDTMVNSIKVHIGLKEYFGLAESSAE